MKETHIITLNTLSSVSKRIQMALVTFAVLAFSGQALAAGQDSIGEAAKGLQMRSIGPAFMGGRIADIDIHPDHPSTWYVAVGSGGVWKTTNAGTTWKPIFDSQGSYSIGDVTIDPNHPDVIWVGTGENVSGRHVGWGDGVYKSLDGGKNWKMVGLEKSEHIGDILVDPRDSNVVYVAAEGPLWSAGGDRGLYRTIDGGESWQKILEVNADTGITDIEFKPGNPDVIYAAAYQRRRHIWGLMAGGPDGGIYKSTDSGENWRKLSTGLPKADVGKIGLAVTPANPSLVYATIESDEKNRGFYRSEDQGESWAKKNSYISGGTGPHYYQELTASPQDEDLVFQMDVFYRVTRDGGANFAILGTAREKHSDNHALWIDPENDLHLISGTDAGLYESFDQGTTWRHFPNLPISQFYKVAVDNAEPFYNVLGGTQDLGTLFGPSRTTLTDGVRNQDWYVPLGADGYGVAFDPSDGNISYMEYQQGYMFRHHRDTNEVMPIQPQPAPGDAPERWNWDTPIVISPHDPARLYVGSQRVWRSPNRGNSWQPVSGDLTTNQNRYEMEFGGRVWSVDDLHDNGAMSKYSTLTSISESPVSEGVLFAGSDDGQIHTSTNGGESWDQAAALPGVPARSFINDIEASLFDANTFFAVADAHKVGDFSPYVFVSSDRGRRWRSISGDLPKDTIVWAIQQDHEDENLLFLGAEYGAYFSTNGGENWHKLTGAPTIAFRDIKIQRRDNDLVGATFGRGIYVLDDYSALRNLGTSNFGSSAALFPVRDAWWYVPSEPGQAAGIPTLGSDSFRTPNPAFGATLTYFLPDAYQTSKELRKEDEDKLRKENQDVPFPGWDRLTAESREAKPSVMLLVSDANGDPIRWIEGKNQKGTHRVTWDLRFPAPNLVNLSPPAFQPPWAGTPEGPLVAPGTYSAQLFGMTGDSVTELGEARSFEVKAAFPPVPGTDYAEAAAFQQETADLMRAVMRKSAELSEATGLLPKMKAAALEASGANTELFQRVDDLGVAFSKLSARLSGDRVRGGLDESTSPSIAGRAYNAASTWSTTQAPTSTQRTSFELARTDFADFAADLDALIANDLAQLKADLAAAGAPGWR